MARKKRINSHKAAGAGKAAKAGGKVSVATSKIAATVAAVAVTGAFGAGAYALTQDATAFNPDGFASAYGKDAQDSSKGYQATTEQTDAQANRHDDASQNKDKSAETSPNNDAFSELPNNGSGTTAVAVDANAKPGTSTVVNDGKGDNGNSNGSGGNPTGPVIDNGGDGNNGNGNGGSGDNNDTPGSDNNGGSPDTPSTPDTPNKPGDTGNNGGGNGNGNGNGGSNIPAETPTDDTRINVIEKDPPPSKEKDELALPGGGMSSTVGEGSAPSSEAIENGTFAALQRDDFDGTSYSTLYAGQRATAWDLFCAINAVFRGSVNGNYFQYAWLCSKDKFPEYSEKYFKIDSIRYTDGTVLGVGDSTVEIPQDDFTINVSYSFDGVTWSSGSAEYHPASSRIYIINPYVAEGEPPEVLATISDAKVAFFKYYGDIINDVAHTGLVDIYDEEGYLTKLIPGWEEVFADEDKAAIPVDGSVIETYGRHVYAPRAFEDIDSTRYRVRLKPFWINNDGFVDADGAYYEPLQTLEGVEEPTVASFARAFGTRFDCFDIPEGVQAVNLEKDPDYVDHLVDIDFLRLPNSVIYLNIADGILNVREGYGVAEDNACFASVDGILETRDGTQYIAVPSNKTELTVPAGVKSVNLYSCNDSLKTITIEAEDADSLPDLDLSMVKGCDIVVNNEDMVDAAIVKYGGNLADQSGNSISAGNTEGKYTVVDGLKMRGDELVKALPGSSSIVDLSSVKKVCAGAFDGVSSVDTIVCGNVDVNFEKDSLAGSSIKYVVCSDEDQAAKMRGQLDSIGAGSETVCVVVRQQSQEGCTYFAADDGHSVLLKASDSLTSFDGTLAALDGTTIAVDAIGPRAFEDCANLRWAVLGESVKLIGAKAFNGCTSLEGLFIGSTDNVTVESNIFSDCGNVAFFASRAMHAIFSGNEIPSYNAVMYCPTNSDGYTGGFQYFTPESGVADYALEEQVDGGYLLYGVNDINQPWLCLSGYASMSGKIKLPSTTTEIFNLAFAGKGSEEGFAINWEELDHLGYVDYKAFNSSKLKGDVVFLAGVNVALEAFEGCDIESMTARGYGFAAANMSFSSCRSLKNVRIESPGGDYASSWVGSSIFEDCPELKSVEFASRLPVGLSLFAYGFGYSFNSIWDNNVDFAGIIKIPYGSLQAYIDEWTYFFAGYSDYDSLANTVWSDLYEANGYTSAPTEQEVRDAVLEKLLPAENTLRMLLGAESVDETTVTLPEIAHDEVASGCTFSVKDGVATLTSVSSEAGPVVDFRTVVPEGCDEVIIAANAFADAPNVKRVILSDKVDQIESGAFNGLSDLELRFVAASAPDLVGGYINGPFAFGCKSLKIAIDLEGYEGSDDKAAAEASFANDLLLYWPMQSLGYEDPQKLYDLYEYLCFAYADEDGNVDLTELGAAADEMLMKQENYFRQLLGMDSISEVKELRYSFSRDFLSLDDETTTSGEDKETPDEDLAPVPTPGTGEAGSDDETAGNASGGKDETGSDNDSGEAGKPDGPTDGGSDNKTDNAGGEGTSSDNSGSADDTEGGVNESSGETVE